jgi:hypothetical protein
MMKNIRIKLVSSKSGWLSVGISLLALAISIGTFYYSYWHESSRLSVNILSLNVWDNDVRINIAFTNNGNRQSLVNDVKYVIGSKELTYLYYNKETIVPKSPIVINPGEIVPVFIKIPLNANNMFSFMDPRWRGNFAPKNITSGPRSAVPIGLHIDSMKSNGDRYSRIVTFSEIVVTDNSLNGYGPIDEKYSRVKIF